MQINKPLFSQSLLAGLLVGIVASLAVLIYDELYRETTGYADGYFVSPAYIFAFIPIVLVVAGCLYQVCRSLLQRGSLWFVLTCVVILIILTAFTITSTSENTGLLFSGFRGMFIGIELITLVMAAIFIPCLVKHPRFWYEDI